MTDNYILEKIGLAGASQDIQQRAIINVRTIAESRLVLLLDEILSDEQRVQFEALQSADDERASDWFLEQFPQLQELYDGIIEEIITDKKYQPRS